MCPCPNGHGTSTMVICQTYSTNPRVHRVDETGIGQNAASPARALWAANLHIGNNHIIVAYLGR